MNVGDVLPTSPRNSRSVRAKRGLPAVTDPNIPVTQGPGNNGGHGVRADAYPTSRLASAVSERQVLPETKATTLTVLLQIYSYLAVSAACYPQNVVEITGLTAPTF